MSVPPPRALTSGHEGTERDMGFPDIAAVRRGHWAPGELLAPPHSAAIVEIVG